MSDTITTPEFATLREKIAWEKEQRAARYARFAEIYQAATEAGWDAHEAAAPRTMYVQQADVVTGEGIGPVHAVSEGVCGFAWINVRPATSSFGRWLVKQGHGRAAYGGGVQIWVSTQTQSYERKMAYAQAFAGVLTASEELAGLRIFPGGRLD